jgi:hypothetical protein
MTKEILKKVLLVAVFFVVGAVAAHATGGSEWQPIWDKVKAYLEGYPGMIAAAFFVVAGLVSFYRGMFAQGAVSILVATGIFLAPTIAQNLASGTVF